MTYTVSTISPGLFTLGEPLLATASLKPNVTFTSKRAYCLEARSNIWLS
jgi:hypothetical protein